MDDLRRSAVCPACHGTLAWSRDAVRCAGCAVVYDVVDGIPVLLPEFEGQGKLGQRSFFDEHVDHEFEIDRPRRSPALHRWLLEEKFRRSIAGLEPLLVGRTALTVCGGSGMDAEFLARRGMRVISSDLSLGAARRAAERARRTGLPIVPIVADAEHLPFRDGSIDLVYVHDGLHHLERPEFGIAEMARVAAAGVSISEPARAGLTAFAVRLGLALEVEDAGNRVARIGLSEVEAELERCGMRLVGGERYAMYYRHEPGRPSRWLSQPPALQAAVSLLRAGNAVAGRFGNKLTVRAVRQPGGQAIGTTR